jgi:hypothetical protein
MPKSVVAEADAMVAGGVAGGAAGGSFAAGRTETLASAEHALAPDAAQPATADALSSTSQQAAPPAPVVSATVKTERTKRVALAFSKAAAAVREVKPKTVPNRQSTKDIFRANFNP